jgi:hypothetical protein
MRLHACTSYIPENFLNQHIYIMCAYMKFRKKTKKLYALCKKTKISCVYGNNQKKSNTKLASTCSMKAQIKREYSRKLKLTQEELARMMPVL